MSGIMRAPGGVTIRAEIPYSGELAIGDSILVIEPNVGTATALAAYKSTGWYTNTAVSVSNSYNTIRIAYDSIYGNKAAFIPGPNH